jgi:putative chitinase
LSAPEIWSVLETFGCGFLPDHRPELAFERHIFTAKPHAASTLCGKTLDSYISRKTRGEEIMATVDTDLLRRIAPRFSGSRADRQSEIINGIGPVIQTVLSNYEITTRLRIAHFLAQICHESAGLRTTEEFADGSAYEGRADLGNVEPGDGARFKGRGLLQLTGRANYKAYGDDLGIDLIGNPKQAADPPTSLKIASLYWKKHGINPLCDADNLRAVTQKVNGGLNGLDSRADFLAKAKAALAQQQAAVMDATVINDPRPVLYRGEEGDAVASLQSQLRSHGFDISIDGDFGAATELAVKQFQRQRGLVPDGIVGPQTWDRLSS